MKTFVKPLRAKREPESAVIGCWIIIWTKQKHNSSKCLMMLKAFEYWFGPYPFYEDGYKLVESPHLGMEHQSAVAYGNGFQNGYLGTRPVAEPAGV